VFENTVPRRIFGHNWGEVKGDCTAVICTPLPVRVIKRRMRWAGHVYI